MTNATTLIHHATTITTLNLGNGSYLELATPRDPSRPTRLVLGMAGIACAEVSLDEAACLGLGERLLDAGARR